MCSSFLLALATGRRISELNALLRAQDFISFSPEGVKFYPNPNFIAKKEDPSDRWDPMFVSRLRDEEGGPHPLCPISCLERFLFLSGNSTSTKLFVHHHSLESITIRKLRWYMCKLIKLSNPESYPRTHDIRKMAASFAFFNQMSLEEICSFSGWRSLKVFRKHYLIDIEHLSSGTVVMGKPMHPSR